MNYQIDTKLDSDASSYSVSDSIREARQSTDRTMEGYDPNRIPSSIFTSKPSNPLEWSLASSESLFSITLGKSFTESNFQYNCKSSTIYRYLEATDSSAIRIDSQTRDEFHEMKLSKTAFIDASEPTMEAKLFPPNEKIGEEEERRRTQVISDDENSEDNASPVDRIRITGSISMQGNQDLTTFHELRPTIHAKFFNPDTNTTTQDNVDEEIGEEEERTSTINECSVLEPICDDEISEDKASPVDKITGSISVQGNQDLSTSFAFNNRSKDRSGLPNNQPPHTTEIEIEEEDVQLKTVNQGPNTSSGGWFSCFHCYFSWKSICCGGL